MPINLPPPPATNGIIDRWLNLLWRKLSAAGELAWGLIDKAGSNLTDIATRSHASLQNLTADDHTQYVLADGARAITGSLTVNGTIGVGGIPAVSDGIRVRNTGLTGTTQRGLFLFPTGSASATSNIRGFELAAATAATSFTVNNLQQLYIQNAGKGAGSTITNLIAIYIEDQTQGTNNYGIFSLVSSGTNKWNIYVSGTAANYFAGDVLFGSATSNNNGKLQVTGSATVSTDLIFDKASGKGIKVDTATPTFGWRDLLGAITVKGVGGGGAGANPDYVVYRGGIYAYRWGTIAPNNHLHEAFIEFHIPHDYVPNSDLFIHIHWSQNVVDTGGTAGVPGVAKWYFEITYADGHGTPGGAADAFTAPITVSVTQQASTTQYGHMIAEVVFTDNGTSLIDRSRIEIDGLVLVRVYRDPTDVADTLNQDTFVHFVDLHYQSTGLATKNKSPNFYA